MPTRDSPWHRWLSLRTAGPLAVALAVLVLGINEAGYQTEREIGADRDAAINARLLVGKLRRQLLMLESAERGYLLTGRPEYRRPYDELGDDVDRVTRQVRELAAHYPTQHDTLQRLAETAARKRSEMAEVMRLFDGGDAGAALELTLTDIGREHMTLINALVDEVLREEELTYLRAGTLRERVRFWSRLAIALLALVCLATLFAALRLGRERAQEKARFLSELAAERDRLEREVDRRTSELTDLARHLQRVREDERSRLARELHDELGGLLTAAKLDVARVRKRVREDGPELAERIAHLGRTLDEGIALKRRIIEDLRPSSLANLGLQRTLEIQCAEFAQRAELPVQTDIDDLTLTPERALAVYRLVQEALTNVAKYAQARRVRVALQRDGDRARLRVEDDGRGFDPQRLPPGAHGLAGMRFRMQSCGGELRLHSAPDAGTVVEATLPL
jgi:signal transduction histidine kinase